MVKKFKVVVNADLEELMPDLLKEVKDALINMNGDLGNSDFENLTRLGHGFKGASATYGLADLSEIFRKIEKSSKIADKEAIRNALAEVADYIANVEIEYAP